MLDVRNLCVNEKISIIDGIQKMDDMRSPCIFVQDEHEKTTGIITDKEIRKWVLSDGLKEKPICSIMKKMSVVVYEGEEHKAQDLMNLYDLPAIPVVNHDSSVMKIIFSQKNDSLPKIHVPVVIMAGGKGTRLHPYTSILPKPLIPVNGKTILERIMNSFEKYGCSDFFLTLNYKKKLIEAYLSDKNKEGGVNFVEEPDFYGTCGSLKLLEGKLRETFFVSNCDVLLDINYSELFDFHIKEHNEITVVTAIKKTQIPYGVFELNSNGQAEKIVEKPFFVHNVNTGIYIMEPNVINEIPEGCIFHMTDLLDKLFEKHRRVGVWPIRNGQWSDMGEFSAMHEMKQKYAERGEDDENPSYRR